MSNNNPHISGRYVIIAAMITGIFGIAGLFIKDYLDHRGSMVVSDPIASNEVSPCADTHEIIDVSSKTYNFVEGLAAFEGVNGKIGYINPEGCIIIPPLYDNFEDLDDSHRNRNFVNGLAWVSKNYKHGFIDKSGEVIVPLIYESASCFSKTGNIAAVEFEGKYFLIDKKGNHIRDLPYDYVSCFSEEVAIYRMNGKYGFLNGFGEVITAPVYLDVQQFSEGRAAVCRVREEYYGKWGFIDKYGKEVIPLIYEWGGNSMGPLDEDIMVFKNGVIEVHLNNKDRFLIDIHGNRVLRP